MARYIDVDNIDVDKYVTVWDCNCSEYGKQTVMAVDDLNYLPTSDVVPRAEAEKLTVNMNAYGLSAIRLKEEVEHLEAQITQLQLDLHYSVCREDEAKAEVAREVFEEIEKVLVFTEDRKRVAELKKKYTGEKEDAEVH